MPNTITTLRLEDSRSSSTPGWIEPLVLAPGNGFVPQRMGIGFPEVRAVVNPRTDADGTIDITERFGAAAVAVDLGLLPEAVEGATNRSLIDRLRAWLLPSLRPWLVYQLEPTDPIRRIMLRADQHGWLESFVTDEYTIVGVGWKAPDGVSQDYEPTEQTIYSSTTPSGDLQGRGYDLAHDRGYPLAESGAPGRVTVSGNVPVAPVIRLYGGCTDPYLINETTGAILDFSGDGGITLAAGEYLEIDVKERTVRLNGDPDESQYAKLNFATSTRLGQFVLPPGPSTLRYTPGTVLTELRPATITFRNEWL